MIAARTRRPVPDHLFGGRLSGTYLLDLTVAAVADHRPAVRTITFTSSDLIGFDSRPGQDVMFDTPGHPETRRRYTIRRVNPTAGTLDIDVVLHGNGPFARWAAATAIGDRLTGIGPRGAITLRDSAHHLFIGDDTASAFTFAMIEALPLGSTATAIVASGYKPTEHDTTSTTPAAAHVIWTSPEELLDAIQSVSVPNDATAYVNGERDLVRNSVSILTARGLSPTAIASKAYWRNDRPNATHGEPSKD